MIVEYSVDLKFFYNIPEVIDKIRFAYVKRVNYAIEM
jgi:hypothetical protein